MFLPREMPLDLGPEHLLGLRMSLNTPVVSTEEIPTGPARAALAVHRDGGGAPTITLAVRPVESSHAVFYGLNEELSGEAGLAMGVDAALSFGESLGFLFDDDVVAAADQGGSEAFELWNAIVGDDELSKVMGITTERSRPAAASPELLETELGEELLLEELALDEDALEGEPDLGPSLDEEIESPRVASPPSLSKFRALRPEAEADSVDAGAEPPKRAFLAKVRLIKRAARLEARAPAEPATSERSLRLLTSF